MELSNDASDAVKIMISDGRLIVPFIASTIGVGGEPRSVVKSVEFLIKYFGATLPQGHGEISSEGQFVFFGDRLYLVKKASHDDLKLSMRAVSTSAFFEIIHLLTGKDGCRLVSEARGEDELWAELETPTGMTIDIRWQKNPPQPPSRQGARGKRRICRDDDPVHSEQ